MSCLGSTNAAFRAFRMRSRHCYCPGQFPALMSFN
jgi:hypothetical protein